MRIVKTLLRDNTVVYHFVDAPDDYDPHEQESVRNMNLWGDIYDAAVVQLSQILQTSKPDYLYMRIL